MKKKLLITCPLILVAFLASGCNRQPTLPEVEHGESVRRVMNSQIHDYESAIHPNPDAVEGSDAYRLNAVLDAHRGDVGNAQEVQRALNTGGGSQ